MYIGLSNIKRINALAKQKRYIEMMLAQSEELKDLNFLVRTGEDERFSIDLSYGGSNEAAVKFLKDTLYEVEQELHGLGVDITR